MSHAATYHTDESGDSESEQNYSDNEGIVFTESNRKLAEEKNNGQVQKSRSRQPKHDVDTSLIDGEVVRLKKRRRTAEVNDLPLHDDDDLTIGSGQTPLKSKSRIWNEQMDLELENAAREFEKDWGLVSTRMNQLFNTNLTNSQCQKRWTQYITPDIAERKVGPWSADEVSLLHILVEQHSKEVQGKVRIAWDTVSKLINRRYYDCQNKWNTIKKSNLKVGRFTAEEDDIIRRTVLEWDGNGVRQGLWIQLQNELGRRNDVIRKRWSAILSKRPNVPTIDVFPNQS